MAEPRRPRGRKVVAVVKTSSPRMEAWMAGQIKPEELTDEEVFRMQLMDVNGNFSGRPTRMVPRDLAQAFRNEAQKRLMGWFVEQVPAAQKAYSELLASRHLAPGDATRAKVAESVFERVIGKVGQETHITVDKGKSFEEYAVEMLVDVAEEED